MSNTVTNQGKTIDQITSVDTISDASKKAYFIAQGVIPVSGPQGGESSATDKETLGVPVASISTDTSNKADKVVPAAAGNLATLNATGNLADSGIAATSVITSHQDISGKADKVASATENNLAKLDSNGNLVDSGIAASAVVTDVSGKADKAVPAAAGNLATLNATGNLVDSGSKVTDFATASQGTKADNAIQGVQLNGTTVTPDASKVVNILVDGGTKIRNSDSGVFDTIVLKGSGGVFVDPNTEEMQVGVDNTTIGLNTVDGELYVKNPVPATTGASNGDVLTYDTTEGIVWKEPQGGGGIPDPTGVTNGYVLTANNGVAGWATPGGGIPDPTGVTNGYVLTANNGVAGWATPGGGSSLPDFPALGSAGEAGWELPVKIYQSYNSTTEKWETYSKAYFVGCPYNALVGDKAIWSDPWHAGFNKSGTTAIVDIDNDSINPCYGLDDDSITAINVRLTRDSLRIPYAIAEFVNNTASDLPITVTQRSWDAENKQWYYGSPDFSEIYPMKPIDSQDYTTPVVIPAGKFAQVVIVGHGFTVNIANTDDPDW